MFGSYREGPVVDVVTPWAFASATEAIQRCAHDLLLTSAEFAIEVTEQVLANQPALVPDRTPEALAAVRESTEQNIGAIFATLAFGIPATATEPPLGARTLLRHVVQGGGDIADLLRSYHYGHGLVWQRWSEHVGRCVVDPDLLKEVLTVSSAHIFTFIDRSCAHLIAEHHEVSGAAGGRPRARHTPADIVDDLVGDGPIDEATAGSVLRYDLRAHHVALVLAPLEAGGNIRHALDHLRDHNPSGVLDVPVGDGTYRVWLGWRSDPGEDVMRAIAETPLVGVSGGMGEVGHGRAGFRRSHRQALEADRVARLAAHSAAGVVRHRDVELAAVLCTDPARARRFAAERLGVLGGGGAANPRLRETVLAYLNQGCNRTRTAQFLHVHLKTVSYRLAQAEELVGAPLSEDPMGLGAALLIEQSLGRV